MAESAHTLLSDLAVVTAVAAITGMAARRLGQPSILGYLLAGLIVGPYIPIPLFADPHRIESLAELGVVLVMFAVGLEFKIERLLEIVPVSGLTALVQIAALLWAGFTVGSWMGWSVGASVTLGAALSISSTMVVSAVLRNQPLDPDVRSHIFGILVVQDVVAVVLMAVVTTLAAGQTLDATSLLLLIAELAGVVLALLVAGMLIVPRLVRFAAAQSDSESLAVLAVGVSFAFAALAHAFGYSPALGAFISGMVVSESGKGEAVEHTIESLRAMFSAVFFVSIGMTVDPLVAWRSLPLALGLTVVVITMQLVSVTVASTLAGNSLRKGLWTGLALGQIGELSFIMATIGLASGLVPKETLPVLVTVATITAFTTPLLLARAPAVVGVVDRAIPVRIHHLLSAYHGILRQASAGDGSLVRRSAGVLLVDWAALGLLVLLRGPLKSVVEPGQAWLVDLGAVVVAAPFLVGLVYTGRNWAAVVAARAARADRAPALARGVEGLALFAVVVWIGLPTLAIVRPLVGGSVPEVVLALSLGAVSTWLVHRGGGFEDAYTSGVAHMASRIAHPEEAESASSSGFEALEGLEHEPVEIPANSVAVGRSLHQLDLRSRTGATVLAICHGAETVVLPTGHERLQALDRVAISGSPAAIERARAVLVAESA